MAALWSSQAKYSVNGIQLFELFNYLNTQNCIPGQPNTILSFSIVHFTNDELCTSVRALTS